MMSNMKAASVREMQHDLKRLLAYVESGEEIAVTRRGRLVARIVPARAERKAVRWPDFEGRLRRLFPGGPPPGPSPSEIIRRQREERF